MSKTIALTIGDPNGIGPEIAVKLLARPQTYASADVVVYTDPAILAAGERVALRSSRGEIEYDFWTRTNNDHRRPCQFD